MAHGITSTDNLFLTRKPGWHGLGHVFEEYPTRAEAQAIAHPWEPVDEPVYRRVLGFDEHGNPASSFEEVEGSKARVRSDNGHTIAIVNDSHEAVTNSEMYDIAEALQGSASDVKFETGGSLYGGSKVWLMLTLDEPISVAGDPSLTVPYYVLQNAHDGSGSFRGQATMVRVVCANTSHVADLDSDARGTEFTFRHTRNVKERIEDAKVALAGWRESLATWQTVSRAMLETRITDSQAQEFVDRFIPFPEPGTVSQRVTNNVKRAHDTWWDLLRGETNADIAHTAYGLVATTIEYGEHYRKARTAESRFRRAYLDRNWITSLSTELVREIAHV